MQATQQCLSAILILFAWHALVQSAELDRPTNKSRNAHALTGADLQRRIIEVDAELRQLASMSLRSGIGAIGYRSKRFASGDHETWIRIDFETTHTVDQIVLAPTIWRDAKTGFRADGFPLQFSLEVGNDDPESAITIADYGPEDTMLPRIAPLVVECPEGTRGSWVRLTATSLGSRLWDGQHDLQLSEIMVFSGEENIALNERVTVSSSDVRTVSIDKRFLVDGQVPYLMDSKRGMKSIAFVSRINEELEPVLKIDLGKSYPVDRLHLHAVDTSDTAPQSHGTDFAVPRHMKVIGSNQSDLSDALELCTIKVNTIYDSGPIIMRRFPQRNCRYVGLIAIEPFIEPAGRGLTRQVGFAEIEVFAAGRNIAHHKTVEANFEFGNRGRSLEALTDGRNFYGDILSIRQWMNQLARRHELEIQRPKLLNQLSLHYAKQDRQLRLSRWLVGTFIVTIILLLATGRWLRRKQLAEVKERFAADLHDELGANLHTIGLLSDLAEDSKRSPEKLDDYLARIRSLTERTGQAVRHLSEVQENGEVYTSFKTDLQQVAQRIAVNLDHQVEIKGEEFVNQLKPRLRADLLSFYKECLVNISRHSGANRLQTQLIGGKKEICLIVSDDGKGLPETTFSSPPPSLLRRAKLLGATVTVETARPKGTEIKLVLQTRKWGSRLLRRDEA